jgi:hypothetical protein
MWRKALEYEVNMATRNDITGDDLISKVPSKEYLNNYANIDFSVKLEQPANELLKDPVDGFNDTENANT